MWRHDVDVSLDSAVRMAVLEATLGVRATYYVMPRSPYYNVFSHHGMEQVASLAELGHRIGVHVDLHEPRDSDMTGLQAAARVSIDHALLRRAHPAVSRDVSFHCPPAGLVWHTIPGFRSAYSPEWGGRYYSDSRGVFAHGDPEDAPAGPIQVNLHPEHWFPASNEPVEGFWR
jgi:hypothetical protein